MKDEAIAPSLQASKQKFEKAKIEDLLKRKISNRPSKERLVEMRVLKEDSSSNLFEKKKTNIGDLLNKKLANRPTAKELEQKNVLHSKEWETKVALQRGLIEQNLEQLLSNKYSDRFSAGEVGEAIPMMHWAEDLIQSYIENEDDEYGSTTSLPPTESGSSSGRQSPVKSSSDSDLGQKTALKKPANMARELSMRSLQHKTLFILDFVQQGKFVCQNCCSEFFEGPEMASPRYSYNNFFDEEDWNGLDFKKPKHHDQAKALCLCNMCYGVCSCGEPLVDSVCGNCGSLKPFTQDQNWRAPDYPRPKTVEDWQALRKEQLNQAEANYASEEGKVRNIKLSFCEEVDVWHFDRYRFRNTLTEECLFLEEDPEAAGEVFFSVDGDNDTCYLVETETENFYYLRADDAGNLFVIAIGDEDKVAKNSTRVYLHDSSKDWYYYGDSGAGKIFCWDKNLNSVRQVG